MPNCSRRPYPLLRGGVAAPYKQMSRYLEQGAAGEVRNMFQQGFDLPRRAEAEVAWHLLDRRAAPSSKEGIFAFFKFLSNLSNAFTASMSVAPSYFLLYPL